MGLAGQLRQLADLAEVRGVFLETTAWRRLAARIEAAGDGEAARLAALARSSQLAEIPEAPPQLHPQLRQILLNGCDIALGAARASLPWLLRRLIECGAIDAAGAARLSRHGVVTLTDLEAALQEGRFPPELPAPDGLRKATAALARECPRLPLGRAADLLNNLVLLIAAGCPDILHLTPAGDVRRFEPMIESLVLAAAAPDPLDAIETICSLPHIQGVLHRTGRRALVVYQQAEVDLRIAATDEYGTVLYASTGSPAHLAAMRGRQRAVRLWAREEDVYSQAGLPWIPPELRQGTGEVEAAASGTLPALVERAHIRGDLHMHTTYSDGRNSIVEMVQAAAALEYEYIAITDHSERSAASRTVSADALARQGDEIARLRERFPSLAILHGIEVEIMPDGRLDFPDDILEGLDIVLASLHDSAGHDRARLTRRCLAAIRHPLVNVITHPANQLVGRDSGFDLDFPALYAAAAAAGTALEIDGAPSHLDLDGARAREAVAAGVTVTIDSDGHRTVLLDRQMRLGVGTARRGWVEPRHVLNSRPIGEVRAFIAAKRGTAPRHT